MLMRPNKNYADVGIISKTFCEIFAAPSWKVNDSLRHKKAIVFGTRFDFGDAID